MSDLIDFNSATTATTVATNIDTSFDDANTKKESSSNATIQLLQQQQMSTATATTAAPYIIQNGNIYQLTSNNQLISRNSIQVNQINTNTTPNANLTVMPATKQTININAPSLLSQGNVALNILNSKLINTNNNIKVATLKNGTLLNINTLPNSSVCKNRIIFKAPVVNLASDYQLKTTKQVLIVPNTNNSNVVQQQQQQQILQHVNNAGDSISIVSGSNNAVTRPVKSPQQTVQYYLSNNFSSSNTPNTTTTSNTTNVINIASLSGQDLSSAANGSTIKILSNQNAQVELNKAASLLTTVNTNTAPVGTTNTMLPVMVASNQQFLQLPLQQQQQHQQQNSVRQQQQHQIFTSNPGINQVQIATDQNSIATTTITNSATDNNNNSIINNGKNNLLSALNNTMVIANKTTNEATTAVQNTKATKVTPYFDRY